MSKGYKLYNLKTRKVLVSKDMLFEEKEKQNWKEGKNKDDNDSTYDLKQKSIQEEKSKEE